MIETLKKTSFDPYLNETFTICSEEHGEIAVELVQITERNDPRMENFSLIFRGTMDKILPQKIHHLKHPKFGEVDLFVVPITYHKHDGMYYQVVFNRLLDAK